MKNITLSAQEEAIEEARQIARRKGTTLNELFRRWLSELNSQSSQSKQAELDGLWERTSYVQAGQKFNREEMNQR